MIHAARMAGGIAGSALCSLAATLAGCSREKAPDVAPVVVHARQALPAVRPIATPTAIMPAPVPTTVAAPRKAFVDPPLPFELVDDARLKPLPPPPPPAAFGQGEQH